MMTRCNGYVITRNRYGTYYVDIFWHVGFSSLADAVHWCQKVPAKH